MRIASLHTYPVKGCHRLDHDEALVEHQGLAGDRRWIVVDPRGVGITQRDVHRLALVDVTPFDGGLRLNAPGLPTLEVKEPVDGPEVAIRVFSSKTPAPGRLVPAAEAWFTGFLGQPARLVWQADTGGRGIEHNARPDDRVSFADGYPLLAANAASLSALGDWLVEAGEEPVPMTRFRPNVVMSGVEAWAEDDWIGRRLRIGQMTFRAAKFCGRCLVTTIDQETAEKNREPLRILGKRRRIGRDLVFGVNLIPDISAGETGIIRVGDTTSVVA